MTIHKIAFRLLFGFSLFLVMGTGPFSLAQAANPMPVAVLLLDEFSKPISGESEDVNTRLSILEQVELLAGDWFSEEISVDPSQETDSDVELVRESLQESIDEYFVAIEALVSDIQYPAESGDLCIANPVEFGVDGQGDYYVTGTGPGSPNLHGEMVSSAIRGAATDPLYAGKLDEGTSALGADYTVEVTDGSMTHVIEVVHADTNSFDLDAVNQQISDYLDGAANPNLSEATHKWVVNASFAIVPCADLATLAAYNDALLALEALLPASARKVVLLQQAILRTAEKIRVSVAAGWQACGMVLEGGVLIQTGDTQYDSCRVFVENMERVGVFVAAAGNTGLDYPYYPASEPSVVSVSASFENAPFIGTITDRDCINRVIGDEPCSNAGEVLMPGVIDFNGVNYFGTSFAAPRLSLRLAVYLARYGDNVCGLLDMRDPVSTLQDFRDIPLADLPGEAPCDELQWIREEVFMD